VIVKAEMPGMDPKEIDVSISGDSLTIRGEKKSEHEERDKSWHRIERSYGTFERVVPLPCAVKANDVGADYKNGVLTVTVAKAEEARPKSIRVNVK
jgi:HSP20 family protein